MARVPPLAPVASSGADGIARGGPGQEPARPRLTPAPRPARIARSMGAPVAKPLRILYVVRTLGWHPDAGGDALYHYRLMKTLARRGHRVHLVAPARGPLAKPVPWLDGTTYVPEHERKSRLAFALYRAGRRRLAGTDVVHLHGGEGVVFAMRRRLGRRPAVVAGNYQPNIERRSFLRESLWRRFQRWTMAGSDLVLATSAWHAREVAEGSGLPPARVRDVSAAVDGPFFRLRAAPPPAPGEPHRLLIVGHVGERKGHDALLRALPLVAAKRAVTLTAVGGSAGGHGLEDMSRLAAETGAAPHVRFAGRLPYRALLRELERAHLFVLPSRAESFGMALAEAMAAGLPVVAARRKCLPEVVGDEGCGLLADPDDPKDLSGAILKALESDAARADMGRRGRERARRLYTWDAVAARVEAAYADAMGAPRPGAAPLPAPATTAG